MSETMEVVAGGFLIFKIFGIVVSDFDIRVSDFSPQPRWISSIS